MVRHAIAQQLFAASSGALVSLVGQYDIQYGISYSQVAEEAQPDKNQKVQPASEGVTIVCSNAYMFA